MFNFLKKRTLGALLNNPDIRDIPVSAFQPIVSLPVKHVIDIGILPVWNQLSNGSCVGQAEAKLKQYLDYNDIKQIIPLSARFLYARCKEVDGLSTQGTFPRNAAKVLTEQGCASEKTVDSNNNLSHEEFIKVPKTDEIINDAKKYKAKGYAFINSDINSIKQAIYINKVVGATVPVGKSYWSILPVKCDLPYVGFHRIMLYGYEDIPNDTKIFFRNSWGSKWGENGNGYFLWSDYQRKVFDIMTYTDIPNSLLENAKEQKYKYKYFKPSEIVGLKDELVSKLDKARELAGVPFILTSGLRTVAVNEEAGGVENSAHLSGLACDIRCYDASTRFKMINSMLTIGFTRIGVYKGHIHVDVDNSKPQGVVWYG